MPVKVRMIQQEAPMMKIKEIRGEGLAASCC